MGHWQGRAFKSNKNLREHVKVHIDRGDILGPNPSSSSRHSPSPAPAPGRTTRASSEAAVSRGRKRTRDPDYVDLDEDSERHTKRLKRTESDVGKNWMCNEPECDKQFKTVSRQYPSRQSIGAKSILIDISALVDRLETGSGGTPLDSTSRPSAIRLSSRRMWERIRP